MKRLRLSITATIGLVLLVAIDCVTVRLLRVRPEWGLMMLFSPDVAAAIFCLPMASLVAIGGSRAIVRQGASRGFWIGVTVVAPLAVVPLFVWREPGLAWLLSKVNPTGYFDEMAVPGFVILYLLTVTLVMVLAQLILVYGGGWLGGKVGRRFARVNTEDQPARRFRVFSALVFVILASLPAIGAEYFRRSMDPELPRFAVGSIVLVEDRDSDIAPVTLATGQVWIPPVGSRVQIVRDDQEYRDSVHVTRHGYTISDGRVVQVKLLDGPHAGETVEIDRFYLPESP